MQRPITCAAPAGSRAQAARSKLCTGSMDRVAGVVAQYLCSIPSALEREVCSGGSRRRCPGSDFGSSRRSPPAASARSPANAGGCALIEDQRIGDRDRFEQVENDARRLRSGDRTPADNSTGLGQVARLDGPMHGRNGDQAVRPVRGDDRPAFCRPRWKSGCADSSD